MGADLYINSIYEKQQAIYKPLIDAELNKRNVLAKERNVQSQFDINTFSTIWPDPEIQKCQDLIDKYWNERNSVGYFRDPYNSWNLLWRFGLSWWVDVDKLIDQYHKRSGHNDEDGQFIGVTEIIWLLDRVPKGDVPIDDLIEKEKDWILEQNTQEELQQHFNERRDKFVAFLRKALELEEPIYCSI